MTPRIIRIDSSEIENALCNCRRQYLVGVLTQPQIVNHIEDSKLEIGITKYTKNSSENPHVHSNAYEYQYMIAGYTVYLNVDTGEEMFFRKGDFFLIEPGVKYAQKSKAGTCILFIKAPPGNDKIDLIVNNDIEKWMNDGIKTIRTDYSNSSLAPKPNSLKPAAAVAIINDGKILMLRRGDSGNWTMPGGTMEFGESLLDCAKREVKEETGLFVEISDLIGTYTNPQTLVQYSDGEVRQEFSLVYYASVFDGDLRIDSESTEYRWIDLNVVFHYELAESQRTRLRDVVEYINNGTRFFK